MEERRLWWLDHVITLVETVALLAFYYDRMNKNAGGDGLVAKVKSTTKGRLKPWHFPEQWKREKTRMMIDAEVTLDLANRDTPPGID